MDDWVKQHATSLFFFSFFQNGIILFYLVVCSPKKYFKKFGKFIKNNYAVYSTLVAGKTLQICKLLVLLRGFTFHFKVLNLMPNLEIKTSSCSKRDICQWIKNF